MLSLSLLKEPFLDQINKKKLNFDPLSCHNHVVQDKIWRGKLLKSDLSERGS